MSIDSHVYWGKNRDTGERVRGLWKKGIYSRPVLQRLFRKMTNNEMCRWHRLKCPTQTDHPIFEAAHRRIEAAEQIAIERRRMERAA